MIQVKNRACVRTIAVRSLRSGRRGIGRARQQRPVEHGDVL